LFFFPLLHNLTPLARFQEAAALETFSFLRYASLFDRNHVFLHTDPNWPPLRRHYPRDSPSKPSPFFSLSCHPCSPFLFPLNPLTPSPASQVIVRFFLFFLRIEIPFAPTFNAFFCLALSLFGTRPPRVSVDRLT